MQTIGGIYPWEYTPSFVLRKNARERETEKGSDKTQNECFCSGMHACVYMLHVFDEDANITAHANPLTSPGGDRCRVAIASSRSSVCRTVRIRSSRAPYPSIRRIL